MKPCSKCKTYRKCNQAGECLLAKKEAENKKSLAKTPTKK